MVSMSCGELHFYLKIERRLELLVLLATLEIPGFEPRFEEVEGRDGQDSVEQIIILECCIDYFCPIEFMDIEVVGDGHVCFRCELTEKFQV